MKQSTCLSEEALTLHYYHELAMEREEALHLAGCVLCKARFKALCEDMARIPDWEPEPDPLASTRIAARVSEQLERRRRNWAPALGASAASLALIFTVWFWSPSHLEDQATQVMTTQLSTASLSEDIPDIEFLEDMELLQQLELLSQIEGV